MTTVTTTLWDLRSEGIADLGASTIKGMGKMEGDDAYDYIDDALMSTIDVFLIKLRSTSSNSWRGGAGMRMAQRQ